MVGQTGLEPVTPRLSSACSNQLSYRPLLELPISDLQISDFSIRNPQSPIRNRIGGGNRIRTDDILLAKQALYQLSYTPVLSPKGKAEGSPLCSGLL
jgi:hypothetical protein